jgi:hypothetical protein
MSELDITVMDVSGSQRQEVTVPGNASALKIIAALVNQMNLPVNSPDNTPMSYKFRHEETGRQLKDEVTLDEAGVNNGDTLRLVPEIVAG